MPIDPKRNPQIIIVRANASPPVRKEGQYGPLSQDLAGRIRILLSAIEGGIIPGDAQTAIESLATAAFMEGYNGADWDAVRVGSDQDTASETVGVLKALARTQAFTGAAWAPKRVSNVFKTAQINAVGPTNVWTPAAGKSFRLLGLSLDVTSTWYLNATGPTNIATLYDGGVTTGLSFAIGSPGSAQAWFGNQPVTNGMVDLGDGYLSTAVDNSLAVGLSVAANAGFLNVFALGVEE